MNTSTLQRIKDEVLYVLEHEITDQDTILTRKRILNVTLLTKQF